MEIAGGFRGNWLRAKHEPGHQAPREKEDAGYRDEEWGFAATPGVVCTKLDGESENNAEDDNEHQNDGYLKAKTLSRHHGFTPSREYTRRPDSAGSEIRSMDSRQVAGRRLLDAAGVGSACLIFGLPFKKMTSEPTSAPPDGLWIIDAQGRTVYANEDMAQILGTTVGDLIGKDSFRYVFPEDQEAAKKLFAAKEQGNRSPFHFRLRREDGSSIWADVQGTPMRNAAGQFIGIVGSFTLSNSQGKL